MISPDLQVDALFDAIDAEGTGAISLELVERRLQERARPPISARAPPVSARALAPSSAR